MRSLIPAVVGVSLMSCTFAFDRDETFVAGEVRGVAVRNDSGKAPARFAHVSVAGSTRVNLANADGVFRVKGLSLGAVVLRLHDDENADGWPDRGGYAAAFLSKNAFDEKQTGFVLIGNVGLQGAMTVNGSVRVDDGADGVAPVARNLVGRVYLTRGQCFVVDAASYAAPQQADCVQASKAELAARLETGAEAETSVDAEGRYTFNNVISGDAEVVVILYTLGPDGGLSLTPVDVLGPFAARGKAGQTIDVEPVLFPGTPPPPGTRRVQLALSAGVSGDAYAQVTFPGQAIPACVADRPPTLDGAVVLEDELGGQEPLVTVPWGVWDLTVCDGDVSGTVLGQASLPGDDNAVPPRWSVLLSRRGLCQGDNDSVDCDADGTAQLPSYAGNEALWASCTRQCGLVPSGDDPVATTCEVDGGRYDCDDDADGQPDPTESAACIGPGRGTDLDGDGLCSTTDPFPQCTANTAEACVAGTNDVALSPGAGEGTWQVGENPVVTNSEDLRDADVVVFQDELGVPTAVAFLNGNLGGDAVVSVGPSFTTWARGPITHTGIGTSYDARTGAACTPEGTSVVCVGGTLSGEESPVEQALSFYLSGTTLNVFVDTLGVGPSTFGALSWDGPSQDPLFVYSGGLTGNGVTNAAYAGDGSMLFGGGQSTLTNFNVPRKHHTQLSILNGTERHVILLGGEGDDGSSTESVEFLRVAPQTDLPPTLELENGALPDLSHPRLFHTATVIDNGNALLVVGGRDTDALASVERLDLNQPEAGWQEEGDLLVGRYGHTATWVPSTNRVIVVGGFDAHGDGVAITEVYDVASRTWSALASMPGGEGRGNHKTVLLDNGETPQLLVVGGTTYDGGDPVTTSLQLQPAGGGVAPGNPWRAAAAAPAGGNTGSLQHLPNGDIALLSGTTAEGQLQLMSVYSAEADAWSSPESQGFATPRAEAGIAVDNIGAVMFGGVDAIGGPVSGAVARIDVSGSVPLLSENSLGVAPVTDAALSVTTAQDLTHTWVIAGGLDFGTGAPTETAWVLSDGQLFGEDSLDGASLPLSVARRGIRTVVFDLLGTPAHFLIGGEAAAGPVASTDIIGLNPTQILAGQSLNAARTEHTATLVQTQTDRTILVVGGRGADGNNVASAEVIGVNTPTPWQVIGGPPGARRGHTATALEDGSGRVLLAGGFDDGDAALASTFLYDPATRTFAPAGTLAVPRGGHTAIAISGLEVLVVGGVGVDQVGAPPILDAEIWQAQPLQ